MEIFGLEKKIVVNFSSKKAWLQSDSNWGLLDDSPLSPVSLSLHYRTSLNFRVQKNQGSICREPQVSRMLNKQNSIWANSSLVFSGFCCLSNLPIRSIGLIGNLLSYSILYICLNKAILEAQIINILTNSDTMNFKFGQVLQYSTKNSPKKELKAP